LLPLQGEVNGTGTGCIGANSVSRSVRSRHRSLCGWNNRKQRMTVILAVLEERGYVSERVSAGADWRGVE